MQSTFYFIRTKSCLFQFCSTASVTESIWLSIQEIEFSKLPRCKYILELSSLKFWLPNNQSLCVNRSCTKSRIRIGAFLTFVNIESRPIWLLTISPFVGYMWWTIQVPGNVIFQWVREFKFIHMINASKFCDLRTWCRYLVFGKTTHNCQGMHKTVITEGNFLVHLLHNQVTDLHSFLKFILFSPWKGHQIVEVLQKDRDWHPSFYSQFLCLSSGLMKSVYPWLVNPLFFFKGFKVQVTAHRPSFLVSFPAPDPTPGMIPATLTAVWVVKITG